MTDRPDHDARDPAFDESELGASYERLQGVFEEFRDADAEIAGTLDSMRNRVMDIVHRESVLGPTTELSTPSGLRFEMLTAAMPVRSMSTATPVGRTRSRRWPTQWSGQRQRWWRSSWRTSMCGSCTWRAEQRHPETGLNYDDLVGAEGLEPPTYSV